MLSYIYEYIHLNMKEYFALAFSLFADKTLGGIGYSLFKISSLWTVFRKGKSAQLAEPVSVKIKKEFED